MLGRAQDLGWDCDIAAPVTPPGSGERRHLDPEGEAWIATFGDRRRPECY